MGMVMEYTTDSGDELVLMPKAEHERLCAAAEMAEDVTAYDSIKAALARGDEERIPAAFANRIFDGENPIRVWRDFRRMKQGELAKQIGITQPYLSRLEKGHDEPSLRLARRIATALGITLDDLEPANTD